MKLTHVSCYSALLVALAASAQQAASRPPEHTTRTKVVLLGTGTPVPDPDRSGPATAIVVDDSAYLVDFGPGVVRRAKAAVLNRNITMLQVSNAETDWLKQQGQAGAEATLVAQVKHSIAEALNVTVKVSGTDSKLAPLVFMAPRSAWWQCVSEQGCRLACWLEVIRALTAAKPARDCFFVALSGHELGVLGMDGYVKSRPELIRLAHAWIFFGSSIGAPRQPNLIHASDEALERWTVATMEAQGLTVNTKAAHDSAARGEAVVVQRGGGRFVTVACDSEVYHSVADRWPEAVDVAILARYAKAFANGAMQLAAASGFLNPSA